MKLIFCPECKDVVKLKMQEKTFCECGKSWGTYTDNLRAVINPIAIPLGFHNGFFINAIRCQPEEGMGKKFEAFVIPKVCPTIKTVEDTWELPEQIDTITPPSKNITTKNGLIFMEDTMLTTSAADVLAQKLGFTHAENLVHYMEKLK
jgi:hypothetical protein